MKLLEPKDARPLYQASDLRGLRSAVALALELFLGFCVWLWLWLLSGSGCGSGALQVFTMSSPFLLLFNGCDLWERPSSR